MTEPRSETVDLGDVRIHYTLAGEGDPVVLLHGWPHHSSQWRDVIPHLAERYQVIAPDLRGFGKSSRPESGYEKRQLADDVWRLAHDVLGHDHLFAVGHSWGTSVAYALAYSHPDAVRAVALLGAPPCYEGNEYRGWWHLFHVVPDLPEALITGREDLYFGWFFENFKHPDFQFDPEVLEEYLSPLREPGAVRAALDYYHAMAQDVLDNTAAMRAGGVSMPVLAVQQGGPLDNRHGGRVTENVMARLTRPLASNLEEAFFEDTGYLMPEERPAELSAMLHDFFARSSASARR